MDELVLGNLVLDQGHDHRRCRDGRRDLEKVEELVVSRVVHPRHHLGYAVTLLRELADHDVVLIVARDRHDDVGWTPDPGVLQYVQLGSVAVEGSILELDFERLVAPLVLLDEDDLVVQPTERSGDVRADLSTADDQDEHQALGCSPSTTLVSSSIAVRVGDTIANPRPA